MPTAIVVPCYNEELRLDAAELLKLACSPGLSLLFVDDGSRDGTRARLEEVVRNSDGRATLLALPRNVGKAEAVRRGLQLALDGGATVVGYLDADLSTPVNEVHELLRALEDPLVSVVLGSRVARAGADIDRHLSRHLTGRIFAVAAALILRERFYDTQCGAKVLRSSPALHEALENPFSSRWAFDVELIGRLLTARCPLPIEAFVEVPLRAWHDVGGSKLGLASMARAGLDLVRIERAISRRRRLPA